MITNLLTKGHVKVSVCKLISCSNTYLCDGYNFEERMFDTTQEITKEQYRYRYANLDVGDIFCKTPLEMTFDPKVIANRLYIHRDLMNQFTGKILV